MMHRTFSVYRDNVLLTDIILFGTRGNHSYFSYENADSDLREILARLLHSPAESFEIRILSDTSLRIETRRDPMVLEVAVTDGYLGTPFSSFILLEHAANA